MDIEPGNDLNLGEIIGHGGELKLTHDRHGKHKRGRHVFICGSSGVGKSKLLEGMVRQDICQWHKRRCGLMLLDPHGAVYNGLMEWLAEREDTDIPIIPIDLTRDDWIVSYNVLRRRQTMGRSVIISEFLEAISHIWGESNTDTTPRFNNIGGLVLDTLYQLGFTMAEASKLLMRFDVQRALVARLPAGRTRDAWQRALNRPVNFDDRTESTENRFTRFEENPILKAMFGQTEVSLDLSASLRDGHIILVNLSTEKGRVSRQDADTFGTLLLSDLWAAARERGKADDIKPFYLYVDEFQTMTTPSIARGLDQARGHGLHLTLACQYPNQLLNEAGTTGKALYDSVIVNAQNKIVFKTEHPENLDTLARQLFMGTFNPNVIKDEIYSTKVMDYKEEIRVDTSESEAEIESGGTARSAAGSSNTGNAEGVGQSLVPGGSLEEMEFASWNLFVSDTHGESESWGETQNQGWAHAKSKSVMRRHVLLPILGKELSSRQFLGLDEQLFLVMQQLIVQEDRHCAVKVVGHRAPVFIRTTDLKRGRALPVRIERFLERQRKKWPFFLEMPEALTRLAFREQQLLDSIREPEPNETAKRRVS